MGPFASKPLTTVSSRLEFARARAEVYARMRSAASWGYALGLMAPPVVMLAALAALHAAGMRSPWLTVALAVLVLVAPFGALAVVPAFLRRVGARMVLRCVHCGAPLLRLGRGTPAVDQGEANPIPEPKQDARGHEVWRTGRCPDCRRRLFEVPEPSAWTVARRRGVPPSRAAAAPAARPRPALTPRVAPRDGASVEPRAPWTEREFRLRVERCEAEMRDEALSTIAWLMVLTFIIWYELHRARTAVVVMGLITAVLALAARAAACVGVLRASPERWALLCPGCGTALTLRRGRQVLTTGRCPRCRAAIIDGSPVKRARAAVPSTRIQLAGSGSRFALMLAAIVGCLISTFLPPFAALDELAGAVVQSPPTRRKCGRGGCHHDVRVPVRHDAATGNIYVAERRLRPADRERLWRLQPGETINAWVASGGDVVQLDLDGRRVLSYDRWIRVETRVWMVYLAPFFIASIIASVALPFRAVRRAGRPLPVPTGTARAAAG